MKEVRIKRALEIGWEGTKNNWPTLLGLLALYLIASTVQELLKHVLSSSGILGVVFWIVSMGVNMLLGLISAQFGLQIAKENGGRAASFGELELENEMIARYFMTNGVMFLAVFAMVFVLIFAVVLLAGAGAGMAALADEGAVLGLIKATSGTVLGLGALLGIGLIYAALVFSFALLAVIHQGLGPIDAFKESMRLTEDIRGDIFVAFTVFFGVMVAGLLALCVGIIPAAMVLSIAWPVLYLDILEQAGPRPDHA